MSKKRTILSVVDPLVPIHCDKINMLFIIKERSYAKKKKEKVVGSFIACWWI